MKPDLYTRMYLWLVAHRRTVLAGVALLMVAAAWMSLRIDLEEDVLDMLPRHDPQVDEYRYALRKFRQIDRAYLDVGIDRDASEVLAHAADEVFARLSTNQSLAHITYRIEGGGTGKAV